MLLFLSTNIAVITSATKPTLRYVWIVQIQLWLLSQTLVKKNKLNHMTDGMKGSIRLAAGKGNLRPLSVEVF